MLSEGLLMVLLVAAGEIEGGDINVPEKQADGTLVPGDAEPESHSATDAPARPSRGYAIELRSGIGRLWGRFDLSGMIDDTTVEGTSIPLEFSAGLHLTDDLILFGELSEIHAFTSRDRTSRADLYGFGLGLKYYGTSTGFFLRGSISRSFFRYRDDDLEFITDWPGASQGTSGRFSMGKEWRSWSRWRPGIAAELVVGRTQPEDYQSFTHVAAALIASVTYDSDDGRRNKVATSTFSSDSGLAPLGLYLDARLGLGGLWVSGGNLFISGKTIPLGVAAGMSLTRDLVVFTEASYISMLDPGSNDSDVQVPSFNLYGAGLGLKYYLTPRKLFLSGSASVARLRYVSTASYYADGVTGDTSHWGMWTRVAVGHEWPVSPYGSIGMAGELQIGRMGKGDHASPAFSGADAYVPRALSLVLLGSLGSPTEYVAQVQPITPTMGMFLSLAFGVGTVSGRIDSRNRDASNTLDYLSKAFPLTLGLGYRFSPRWSGDVSVAYAPLTLATIGDTDSAKAAHLGAALRWHWLSERLRPWVSLGLGFEWLSFRSNGHTDVGASGYDLDLQIGSDSRLGRSWTLGPYASARVGRYRHLSLHPHWRGGSPSEEDLSPSDSAMHEWFTIGVRGTFASVQ